MQPILLTKEGGHNFVRYDVLCPCKVQMMNHRHVLCVLSGARSMHRNFHNSMALAIMRAVALIVTRE